MSQDFPLLSAALGTDGIVVTDNVPSVSMGDLYKFEAAIAERDRQIDELQKQIDTLKAAPADSTTNVVDVKHAQQEETPLEAYYRRLNAAKEMFNSIP